MEPTSIVYDRQWTADCIDGLRFELQMLRQLENIIVEMRFSADESEMEYINRIIRMVKQLENKTAATHNIMQDYMYDMEKGITVVVEKIESANVVGSKILK